jgi:hypothetical protein
MMPMRGTFTGGCAGDEIGQAAAAPPRRTMNSRQLQLQFGLTMGLPRAMDVEQGGLSQEAAGMRRNDSEGERPICWMVNPG